MQEKISQEERRDRFGKALSEALAGRNLKQSHLAELLATTQSTVSAWINGRSEPAASTVFTVERCLDLSPGFLSKTLGYLPVSAVGRAPNVEEAVAASEAVDQDAKRMVLSVWFTLVAKQQAYERALKLAEGQDNVVPMVTNGATNGTHKPVAKKASRSAAGKTVTASTARKSAAPAAPAAPRRRKPATTG